MYQIQTPNLYVLQNEEITITYATSSLEGKPRFHYQQKEKSVDVSGTEIRAQQLEMGQLITVTIEMIPDLSVSTLSILLPLITIKEQKEISFSTIALFTRAQRSLNPASIVIHQTYANYNLEAIARKVEF